MTDPLVVLAPEGEKGPWGVLDTQDDLWMGNTKRPFVFGDYGVAYLAALYINESMDWHDGRAKPRVYVSASRMRDEVPMKRSMVSAMERLETGVTLPSLPRPRMADE